MPRLPLAPARRRPRRQLFAPMAAGLAARRIQAAARGFLARRRVAGMRRPRLMSPMDISKISRKRAKQGQIPKGATRAVMPKFRIGSLIGTEKSKRSVSLKKLDPLEIKLHTDSTSIVDQGGVAYFGFPDAGPQDEQLKQGCYALVNLFTRRSGLKLCSVNTTITSALSNPVSVYNKSRLNRIVIGWTRHDADGNGEYFWIEYDIASADTIKDIGLRIYADIKEQAYNPGGVATDGKWPSVAHLQAMNDDGFGPSAHQYKTFATYDLTNVMTDFAVMRKYKWQNVTPAGENEPARVNLNDIQANPLSGKIYKFKGPTPLIRTMVTEQLATTLHDSIEAQGAAYPGDSYDYLKTEAFRDNSYANNLDVPFRQPFKANQFFKNALTEDKVYMPPGGYKQLIRKADVKMNFRRFCQATVYIQGDGLAAQGYIQNKPAKIGTSTMWGLEPAVRTSQLEHVKVAINMETWYTTKCRVSDKKQPVVTDIKMETGHTFGT